MLADDASPASLRSYAYELLAWFRFLGAVAVAWDLAGRAEARDFALWLKTVRKPVRQRRPDAPAPGSVNPVTGKATPGENYAARTRRHARAVIRAFYEYHREMHGRPLVNPFPQAKGAEEEQLNAHHNPMQPFRRPPGGPPTSRRNPSRRRGCIPDPAFNDLFAALACNRDRALIAFYISTGARASELLGVPQGLVAPEEQTIGVIRKGSRALQRLPASADAFVWLRLYQQEMRGLVPGGPDEPVWWTLRRPFRPLTYDAARMVFTRANAVARCELDVARSAAQRAKRMVRDPHLTLADVQWVPGHAHITTTEIYPSPPPRRSSRMSWRITSGSGPSRAGHRRRQRRATGRRCWQRCSACQPRSERPDERRRAPTGRRLDQHRRGRVADAAGGPPTWQPRPARRAGGRPVSTGTT